MEQLREKVYASLEEYCKMHYPDEPGRFAKLLLRLPALRSIGLKCLEHLFFFKLIGDTPIDTFLLEMLESPSPSSTWLWSSIPPCVLKRVWRCFSSKYCRSNTLLCFKPCILLMGLCTNSWYLYWAKSILLIRNTQKISVYFMLWIWILICFLWWWQNINSAKFL